tara:strand:+ start:2657 stop:2983 length:327 start_codon:yes stop_codon:yes gene_type:complete
MFYADFRFQTPLTNLESVLQQYKSDKFSIQDEELVPSSYNACTLSESHFREILSSNFNSSFVRTVSVGVATFSPRSKRISMNMATVDKASAQMKYKLSVNNTPKIEMN